MQAETLKNARAAVFLHRSALCLLMLPAACLLWALQAYPPQDAYWLSFVFATFVWPFAGILFIVSAGLHDGTVRQRPKKRAGWHAAHGH
ncbi:conserved hypothetical protein [Paraburkholderia sacchari]|uniref:hypothetical protein n=1 Tax=Paraburkholderia sacchari TaxID=159450 RepID=UPI0039A5C26A